MKIRYKNSNYFLTPVIILFFISLLTSSVFTQTRSKIIGEVKDAQTGEKLIGVNVILVDTKLGAATDVNGKYFIINVPVGTYKVQASMIGYAKKTVTGVIVAGDRVTTVDFELTSDALVQQEVVVTAERNSLHREVSSTQLVVTDELISNSSGVREINALLEKQPGISSSRNGFLEIRGGSADQTGTMLNGLSYNNAAVGNSETIIPLSAIEQVSVLSGGFNAEYGNFRSGVINVTTKSGSKDKYHGTISISQNVPHLKRFGPYMKDVTSSALRPYLDPTVAFIGTEEAWKNDSYTKQQYESFTGWIKQAELYNSTRQPKDQATPLDMYLLAAWMHMAIPDYEGLAKLGYTVPEEQKKIFEEHAWNEEGTDYNIDAGFGGPIPLIGEFLGDGTFYISHNSKEKFYIVPVSKRSENTHVTLGTLKMNPLQSLTLSFNMMWKRQLGVSPIRPAFGDFPDSKREGGFMPVDNIYYFIRTPDQWYDPPLFPLLDQTTLMGGATVNHVLSPSTYYETALSYLSIRDHSPNGDNRNQTALTHFGPFVVTEMPYGKLQFAGSNKVKGIFGTDTISYTYPGYDAVPGIATRRFRSKEGDLYTNVHTQQYRAKFDIVSQFGEHHYIKGGIEYNLIDIDHRMWMKWNNNAYNTYEYNYHRKPSQTGLYLQDQITYEGIVANIGLRGDYFYGGGGKWPGGDPFSTDAYINVPFSGQGSGAVADSFYQILASGRSIIWEYWEQYDKEHPGFLQAIKNHFTLSPRLGIAFPVTTNSKFYFNYGHFRSNPPYHSMFLIRYRYTKNGLYNMPNPNQEPPKTVSYELGVTYNPIDNYILTLSGYYKDVTGQYGEITYINTAGTINYDSWSNNNYEDVQGIEFNITKSDNSWLTGWINFNYMLKKQGLTGRKTITETTIDDPTKGLYEDNTSGFVPQPRFTANVTFKSPKDFFDNEWLNQFTNNWTATLYAEWKAGTYFTWNPANIPQVVNNLQWPDYYMVDLRLSKGFNLFGFSSTFFLDISNIFNFKVSLLSKKYAFNTTTNDYNAYLASLHLPIYNSSDYDDLRAKNPGLYIAGDDKVGDLRSNDKPYINDPNYSYFIYGYPRDIWFGLRVDF